MRRKKWSESRAKFSFSLQNHCLFFDCIHSLARCYNICHVSACFLFIFILFSLIWSPAVDVHSGRNLIMAYRRLELVVIPNIYNNENKDEKESSQHSVAIPKVLHTTWNVRNFNTLNKKTLNCARLNGSDVLNIFRPSTDIVELTLISRKMLGTRISNAMIYSSWYIVWGFWSTYRQEINDSTVQLLKLFCLKWKQNTFRLCEACTFSFIFSFL